MNNFTIVQFFKNFQGRRKIFDHNKMFLKDDGHNQFWQHIQGKSLALKDIWQPY